jgi:hypothetical protein
MEVIINGVPYVPQEPTVAFKVGDYVCVDGEQDGHLFRNEYGQIAGGDTAMWLVIFARPRAKFHTGVGTVPKHHGYYVEESLLTLANEP